MHQFEKKGACDQPLAQNKRHADAQAPGADGALPEESHVEPRNAERTTATDKAWR
jgi:hypothetical protein